MVVDWSAEVANAGRAGLVFSENGRFFDGIGFESEGQRFVFGSGGDWGRWFGSTCMGSLRAGGGTGLALVGDPSTACRGIQETSMADEGAQSASYSWL